MNKKKYFHILIITLVLLGSFNNTGIAQKLENTIDSLLQTVFKDKNGPGGEFLVVKKNQIIYQKSYGKANLELDLNLGTNFVFQIGSMTKQFTAVSILLLEEQGKLNLSDSISKYIPDFPNGNNISIHHLLTHTSGIKDFTKMNLINEISQKEMEPKMLIEVFKNEPREFNVGEKFEYNNSGYVLLGYIIELISKESYSDFVQKNIFSKLSMSNSFYASDRKIISQRAYGYHKKTTGYVNKTQINFSIPYAAGSLMSTVRDMSIWQNALNNNLLLNEANLKKAFTSYFLNNGENILYGYGWHIKNIKGINVRSHGGSIFGFKSMGVYVPSEDVYVIGLTNCDCISPTVITEEIAILVSKFK